MKRRNLTPQVKVEDEPKPNLPRPCPPSITLTPEEGRCLKRVLSAYHPASSLGLARSEWFREAALDEVSDPQYFVHKLMALGIFDADNN